MKTSKFMSKLITAPILAFAVYLSFLYVPFLFYAFVATQVFIAFVYFISLIINVCTRNPEERGVEILQKVVNITQLVNERMNDESNKKVMLSKIASSLEIFTDKQAQRYSKFTSFYISMIYAGLYMYLGFVTLGYVMMAFAVITPTLMARYYSLVYDNCYQEIVDLQKEINNNI